MAYAVLFSLAQSIDQFLSHDHYPISDNGKQQISSLHKQVISLQEFVELFPDQATALESRITNAANEAEDTIEHFMYEEIKCRHKSARPRNDLYDFHELKIVEEELNSISREATAIKTESGVTILQSAVTTATTSSSSSPVLLLAPAVSEVTVGLEKDLEKIKESLSRGTSKREIIPITGMGGIGKTTLARNAYHDESITESFPIRAWVTVSQDYKTENIFLNLLDSLQKIVGEGSGKSSDTTEDKVYKILMVRKYLIVLDDLWSEKAWDDIRRAFPDNGKGSRIMITTRERDVASHVNSAAPLHEMRFMDHNQSWELLKQKVFQKGVSPPAELVNIGKDIARSCGGLPLAIVLVAGILSAVNQNRLAWDEIAKDVHSAVEKEAGQFEKIISLSYTHLPHHLRPCFLYMGSFPEDYEIRVSKLIRLWIAEGFVKPPTNPRSLEEGAEIYLDNLVKRSLALVASRKSNGKIKSCNVHDMVRDLCKKKALDENYERRLSIGHPDLTRLTRPYGSTLRSVVSIQQNESSLGGVRKFKLLRVLDVVDTTAYSLPAPVFELFHLRYLAFGCPMEIPAAISRLQNLRSLIIRPSKRFRQYSNDELYLPLEIWMLPLLTNLVSFFDLLPNPEVAAEKLLTLSVVKKLICTKEMMEMIPNIKKMGITYFGDKYQEDYQLHNLVLLHQLENLKLVMKSSADTVLHNFPIFPATLKKLTLSGWRFPWTYLEAVGSFPSLQVLKLRDHACEGEKWETKEEQFPKLEFLLIDESDLEEWVTESGHFPSLRRLVLYRCSSLTEITEDIGEITALQLIEVDKANKALVECVKQIQEEQQDNGNNSLQVRFDYYKGF